MNKSLLVASFTALVANVLGMNPNYHGESSGRNSNNKPLREIRPAPISYNELKRAYNQLIAENFGLKNQNFLLNQQLLQLPGLESSVRALQTKNRNLESLLQERNSEIDNLKDVLEKETLMKRINAEKFEKENKQLKKVQKEKEELESSLQEKDKRIEELTEKLNNLQREKEETEKQLEEYRNSEKELTEKIEKLNQRIEKFREKRQKLKKENEEKNTEIENLIARVTDLEQQLERTRENEQRAQQEKKKLKDKINQLNQQIEQEKTKSKSSANPASKDEFTHIKSIRSNKTHQCNIALYRQSHYDLADGVYTGGETPTTILVKANGRPEKWESVLEVHYANDISYKKIGNPKVIFYRSNKDECYIVLKIDNKSYGIVYGTNECCKKMNGKNPFLSYKISEYIGSFTDNISRLIYVDNSGLYIVSAKENPLDHVTNIYKEKGQFDFKGSVIKVSAIDGNLTLNNEKITKDNFFDNWIKQESRTVRSTKQPDRKEILVNFCPPTGSYRGIYDSIGPFSGTINWLNSFVKIRTEKSVEKGKFRSNLITYLHNGCCLSKLGNVLVNQVRSRNGKISLNSHISSIVVDNKDLFKDLDFVRSLKPKFAEIEKNCERKETSKWPAFEIVKNL